MEECFHFIDKSLASILMAQLMTMKFDGSQSILEHIIEITNIAVRLKTLGTIVDDTVMF